jgi:ATP-dependent DNA helicase RecG
LGLTSLKNNSHSDETGINFSKDVDTSKILGNLGFALTKAQQRVVGEIMEDMESTRSMNRLVQGDVGSGKTVVSALAMYKAVKSGYQAVMMAPTEILATQHYEEIQRIYKGLDINVAFLSGSVKKKERDEILNKLEAGEINVMIGTHALIQEDVKYRNLGLAVTDEQHRFGVRQRISLSQKGRNADVLVMTATPIPRTLAFILYGDLDISVIDELPPGRQKIITKYAKGAQRKSAYEFVRKQVELGRQAYIVAPLIEDSEVMDQLKSAESLYKNLQKTFAGFNIALLHGGMKQADKNEIMDMFYKGDIQILISTVVIEVGINVKNATVMVIENADRFGLAQLHQLRGRVGRGEHQSYCLLISDSDTEEAKERLTLMTKTDNGFEISEKDLEMRGPGDLLGSRQHGLPQLRLADLVKHVSLLDQIKKESRAILTDDPDLKKESNKLLKKKINNMFHSVERIGL